MSSRSSARTALVLVVSRDQTLTATVASALSDDTQTLSVDEPRDAEHVMESTPLEGVVLDMVLLGQRALALARTFLRCQPTGRVILIEGTSGHSTLIGLSFRDPRVEMLTRPIDASVISEVLPPRNGPLANTARG